jgi:hypothetical protein
MKAKAGFEFSWARHPPMEMKAAIPRPIVQMGYRATFDGV